MAIAPVARLRDAAQDLEPALHRAKFAVPVAPRRFVARERLLSEATAWGEVTGSGAAITIVCAPAGAGKSTLVAAAARARPSGTLAWCRLDTDDDAPHQFGMSVLEAVLTARTAADLDRARVRAAARRPIRSTKHYASPRTASR